MAHSLEIPSMSQHTSNPNNFLATISAAITNKNKIQIKLSNFHINALVDTGANISVVCNKFLRKLFKNPHIYKSNRSAVTGVCNTSHAILGQTDLEVDVNGLKMPHTFHILENLPHAIILGQDFLEQNNAVIDLTHKYVSFHNETTIASISTPDIQHDNQKHVSLARTESDIMLPPLSESTLSLLVSNIPHGSQVFLEPVNLLTNKNLVGSKCIATCLNNTLPYRILNPLNKSVPLKANSVVSKVFNIDNNYIICFDTHSSDTHTSQSKASTTDHISIAKTLQIHIEKQNLSPAQTQQLQDLIGRNRDVFAKDATELGKTNLHTHSIITNTDKPVRTPRYSQNPKMRQETERQIQEMLKNDVIEESTSPYQSPVVMVKKSNGQYRFAVDYRKLNSITELVSFPIPKLDEVFDTIADSKSKIFSVLDLASGFWQVPLDEKTKHKTAFITHQGLYQFKRLPFGLTNAPTSYQMLMTKVLQELNWKIALIYIDDILVFSKSFDEHLQHLDLIFQKLRKANLTLQPTKCHFAAQEVKYLGHIISEKGVEVDRA